MPIKLEWCPGEKNFDDIYTVRRLDTIPEFDWLTDRRTDEQKSHQYRASVCWLAIKTAYWSQRTTPTKPKKSHLVISVIGQHLNHLRTDVGRCNVELMGLQWNGCTRIVKKRSKLRITCWNAGYWGKNATYLTYQRRVTERWIECAQRMCT